MSATEELRRLLDERGVAHSDHYLSTTWRDEHGILHLAGEPMADGSLVVDMLTPEQAIAATLGSERTCSREKHGTKMDGSPKLRCSLCGYGIGDKRWSYCPSCGAKVVGE